MEKLLQLEFANALKVKMVGLDEWLDYHIKAESELFREFNVIPLLNYLSKREYAKPIPMQCNPIILNDLQQ